MKRAALVLSALLLLTQPLHMLAADHAKDFVIGTYLGEEMQPDGTNGTSTTMHRTYFVRTNTGTWSLVCASDLADAMAQRVGLATVPFRKDHALLFDNLKHGDKFAFRSEPDRRIGASSTSYHVYIPRADEPKKEDKFDAEFTPVAPPLPEAAANDNIRAMCEEHRFSPDQERQYCGNQ